MEGCSIGHGAEYKNQTLEAFVAARCLYILSAKFDCLVTHKNVSLTRLLATAQFCETAGLLRQVAFKNFP